MTQQQIDELLGNLQSGNMDFKEIEKTTSGPKVKEYAEEVFQGAA